MSSFLSVFSNFSCSSSTSSSNAHPPSLSPLSSSLFFSPPYQFSNSYYRGRGAFESLGAGLSMEPGDIAFKCNFATLEEGDEDEGDEGEGKEKMSQTPLVASRRADRDFEDAGPVFCSALDGLSLPSFPGVTVRVKYATEHRAGVVVSTKRSKATTMTRAPSTSTSGAENGSDKSSSEKQPFELSDSVSGTDPLKDNLPLRRCVSLLSSQEQEDEEEKEKEEEEEEDDEEEEEGEGGSERERRRSEEQEEAENIKNAETTAAIVNELSDEIRKVLRAHPLNLERRKQGKAVANALLLRGCGARAPLPTFAERFGFARACAVAPTKIIAGLALCAGFEVLECARGTGDYRTSLKAKVDAVVDAIKGANEERRRKGEEEHKETGEAQPQPSSSASPPIFVLLHIKAVDDAGHDRAPFKKVAWLRAVDAALARLARKLEEISGSMSNSNSNSSVVVAVTGDHSTPVEFGDHSCEPVPFAAAPLRAVAKALGKSEAESGEEREGEIVAPSEEQMRKVVFSGAAAAATAAAAAAEKKKPSSLPFDETSASHGSLGRFPGAEVMPLLVRLSAAWG